MTGNLRATFTPRRRLSPRWRRVLIVCSIASLVWAIVARVAGPSDMWDQTQSKTVSYTTDIITHSNWILPIERGEFPATKPPLYNWLAAPAVHLGGFANAFAHKLPSVLALIGCWIGVVWLGCRLDRLRGGAVGWVAGIILPANYTIFKLGYLARPDMLLTLWLFLAWGCATLVLTSKRVHSDEGNHPPRMLFLCLAYWLCVGLAGLTKGPPALLGIFYAPLASRLIDGSTRGLRHLGWWWGLPLSLTIVGSWLAAAWMIDPTHVREQLWFVEIWGRVTGIGQAPAANIPLDWLLTLPDLLLFFFVRFSPWSFAAGLGIFVLVSRNPRDPGWRLIPREVYPWLCASTLFVLLVIGLFSLSVGKRADYLAPAYPVSSLLASWFLLRMRPWLAVALPWFVPSVAGVALLVMTIVNQDQPTAPSPNFSARVETFIDDAGDAIARQPGRVVFWHAGPSHLQAFLGRSVPDRPATVAAALEAERSFWVVCGGPTLSENELDKLDENWQDHYTLRRVLKPRQFPGGSKVGWPEVASLYSLQSTNKEDAGGHSPEVD